MTFENIKTKINEVLPTSISERQKSRFRRNLPAPVKEGSVSRAFGKPEGTSEDIKSEAKGRKVFRKRGSYFIDYSSSKAPV